MFLQGFYKRNQGKLQKRNLAPRPPFYYIFSWPYDELTSRADISILAYSYHLLSSVQHEDGQPEETSSRLAELCTVVGSYPSNVIRSNAVAQPTCRNTWRQLWGSGRCGSCFPPGRQELQREHYFSPPKSSLALCLSQESSQDVDAL